MGVVVVPAAADDDNRAFVDQALPCPSGKKIGEGVGAE